jgi:hypothetical protein
MNGDAQSSGVDAVRKISGEHLPTRDDRVAEIGFDFGNPVRQDDNICSRHDGDTDFKFLARDTVPPYVDNRPMLVAGKPELPGVPAVISDFVRAP